MLIINDKQQKGVSENPLIHIVYQPFLLRLQSSFLQKKYKTSSLPNKYAL
jgi:hypothetical protein